ncbi:unnamed protein product [Rotaria sp. Silwood2]|nr:unnamed protein product [Rotaria sp. Silwood2]CAF3092229.1 unnamed protein product [Rotaria sp. Silwood2]CAF3331368.1 unnamed protein product [Rotaria sp. Silwood2]CAF3391070.1 unnamed protein product [Rotaria sp. Silwood2]
MGKNVNIRLIDFPLIHPRASNLIKAQYRNFRDQLTKMILTSDTHRRERDKRVSTMKKTSKDSYDQYISDQANRLNANQQRIKEIRIAPVYYLLAKSSCDCGQADTGGWQESQETFLQGTIRDPIQPDRIRLAYAHK